MIRAFGHHFRRLSGLYRREDGTASMEFVLMVPVIIAIFMSSFESGLLMTREIMLEQSVDIVMRELRLGHYGVVVGNDVLKTEICKHTVIFPDCIHNIKIQLDRVPTTTWAIPAETGRCINSSSPIEPVTTPKILGENDLMLIRVCVSLPAMFPGSGLVHSMALDDLGYYGLIARSAFVVEPS